MQMSILRALQPIASNIKVLERGFGGFQGLFWVLSAVSIFCPRRSQRVSKLLSVSPACFMDEPIKARRAHADCAKLTADQSTHTDLNARMKCQQRFVYSAFGISTGMISSLSQVSFRDHPFKIGQKQVHRYLWTMVYNLSCAFHA